MDDGHPNQVALLSPFGKGLDEDPPVRGETRASELMVQTSHDPMTVIAFSLVVIFYLSLIAYLARLLLARPTRHPVLFLGAVTTLAGTLPVILYALSAAVA